MPTSTELTNRISEILGHGKTAALVTIVESGTSKAPVGAKMTVSDDDETFGSFGDETLDEYVRREADAFLKSRATTKILLTSTPDSEKQTSVPPKILFERIEAEPRLVIAGAGHVGASLARFGAIAGFRVTLIDDRGEFVDRSLF